MLTMAPPRLSRWMRPLRPEVRNEIRAAVIGAVVGGLFGSVGTLWTERQRTQEEAEQRRRQIVLSISERASATAGVLARMTDAADLVLNSMEHTEFRSGVRNISEEFKNLHLELQDKAWRWPWYVVEEAQVHAVLDSEALGRLRVASQLYIDVLKSQVKHVWTLHALCIAPSYDKERVQEVRVALAKLQAEEREAVERMKAPFGRR